MTTKIEWTEETWNPVTGCSKISPGCQSCYAEALCRRFWRQWDREPPPDHFKVKVYPERLSIPFHWKKPRRIFACSMGDLFHSDVCGFDLSIIFNTMRRTPQHTYQVLTKRADLMKLWIEGYENFAANFPHVWLGVTAENQECADSRIPELLKTPAAVRFVSVEPMLERIDLWQYLGGDRNPIGPAYKGQGLDQVIIGCESGPKRRPMEWAWAIELVRQCRAAGVPVFVKQIPVNGKVSKDPSEWPMELRVREYPR